MTLTEKTQLFADSIDELPLDTMRKLIGIYLTQSREGGKLWDILTALRGPDAPSESFNDSSQETYQARRERKYKGVEIIRQEAFFGMVGSGARHHKGDTVTLIGDGDHHDRHLVRAAEVLGLKVKKEKK